MELGPKLNSIKRKDFAKLLEKVICTFLTNICRWCCNRLCTKPFLNAFDFSYDEAFKIKDSPVLDLVVGKNHVYSLHQNGKVYKSNFKNEA